MQSSFSDRNAAEEECKRRARKLGTLHHVVQFRLFGGGYSYQVLSDHLARHRYGEDFEQRFLCVLSITF